ncbi:MAG: ABC transporter ATP-binding protein [Armatimonadetes bacterium]|nr:ABC transporter ATP-binding protein [Armatimonadota bacterium]
MRFDGVGHRFGRRILYAQLSFTVAAGEALVICGANGSGKSTLLRIVAGLLQPTTGSVIIERDGQPLPRAAWRAAVGYLSPETMPYRPLTVRENLDFFARVRGLAGWSDELVEELGLTARLDDPVSALSSGYVQRVKLAVALLHEPPVLLLDEPGVTLDDEGQRRVGEVVARQRQRGLCLLAANDPRDVAYGTRIMRLGG